MTDGDDPNQDGKAGSHPASHAELVHETRKAIKRMRALARLLRYGLGERELKRVNNSLRVAGQRLAGARDAEVRLATLEHLIARHPKALALKGVELLQEQLERERGSQPANRQEMLEDIVSMRRELARWRLIDLGVPALAPGLERIYREGRHRYGRVRRGQALNPEEVHNWRKRVKGLYYALDMLGASKSKDTRGTTRRALLLGDLLGEEHDLWMLAVHIEQHSNAIGRDISAYTTLLKLIARRRGRLRKRALKLGARLYERPPANFTRRIVNSLTG